MTAFWTSLHSLVIFDRIFSANVEDHVNTLAGCSFMQNHGHHNVSQFNKCFLVASYLLDHYHSVKNSPARLKNHICCCHILLAGSLASHDLLVLLNNPLAVSRAQGRGPRGWFSTSFISNVLFSAAMIIWANCARSALMITSLLDSICPFIFLFKLWGS